MTARLGRVSGLASCSSAYSSWLVDPCTKLCGRLQFFIHSIFVSSFPNNSFPSIDAMVSQREPTATGTTEASSDPGAGFFVVTGDAKTRMLVLQ